MNRLTLSFAAMMILAIAAPLAIIVGPATAVAAAKMKDPETVIRAIYKQYDKKAGPAEAEQQNFSPSLLKLWNDVQGAADAVDQVGVDFDVFLHAQDVDLITNVQTKFTPDGADKGAVDIKFTAFGTEKAMTFAMVKTAQGWKIDNISWGADHEDLRTTLAGIRAKQ